MNTEDKEMRVYELGFLFVPTIAQEHVAGEVEKLKEMIAKHEGVMVSEEFPKMIDLAYEMVKVISNKNIRFNQGYFGWLKFDMEPEHVVIMNEELGRSMSIIRFLLIKTVRENTVTGKRVAGKTETKRRVVKKEDAENTAPINPEELDKQIDALVEEETEVV